MRRAYRVEVWHFPPEGRCQESIDIICAGSATDALLAKGREIRRQYPGHETEVAVIAHRDDDQYKDIDVQRLNSIIHHILMEDKMGVLPTRSSINWLNVSSGHMRWGDREIGGFAGCITGIRTREQIYNGKASTKIEVRMEDANQPGEIYVISGTMLGNDGQVTTFGWMLVSRLVNPENGIGLGIEVAISVYPAGETKASCCAVRHAHDGTPLPGHAAFSERSDSVKLRDITLRAVAHLKETFGDFGQTSESDEDHEQPFDEPVAKESKRGRGAMPQGAAELYGAPVADPFAGVKIPPHTDDDLPF